jgi:Peptidogalycan biosysnthesis/recognition
VPNTWNAQLPAKHPLQLAELSVVQNANINNVKPLYILVHQDGVCKLQLYAQVLTFSPAFISQGNLAHPFRVLSKFALNCMQLKLLVMGHLFRHDGIYHHFTADVKDKQQFFSKAIEAIQQQVKHNAIFLKDLPAALSMAFKMNPRYQAFDNDVSMQLAIPPQWQSLADYEKALTKKYAKRLRTTQKQFEGVHIRELSTTDVEQYKQEIFALYLQVAKNQTITFGLLNEHYFPLFKQQMGDALKMYGYFFDDKMIAFSSSIIHEGAYDMNYIGFDYGYNQQLGLYFNMLFCCVHNAIQEKCHTLILGRTALEAKAILGCKPVPIKGYYKINNAVFAAITKRFTNRTAKAQGDLWMNRHPFKEEVE